MYRKIVARSLLLLITAVGIIDSSDQANAQISYYDDTSEQWSYTSGWSLESGGPYQNAFNGTLHLTASNGARAVFSCDQATYIAIYGSKAYNRGIATVTLDGGTQAVNIDLYAPGVQRQQFIYGWAVPPGRHIITLINTGTANVNSTAQAQAYVDVDYGICLNP